MKKLFLMMVCAITLCAGFTSCSSDDDDPDPQAEVKRTAGIEKFKSVFYKNGQIDKSKLAILKGTYYAATEDYNGPINAYNQIVGSYGSESWKDNKSSSTTGVKGTYEYANNTMGIKISGSYQPNGEGLYATMTINMAGIDIKKIEFYEASQFPDLTPFK